MASFDSSYRVTVSAQGSNFSVAPARSALHRFSFSLAFLSLMLASGTSTFPVMLAFVWLYQIPVIGPLLLYALSVVIYLAILIGSYKLVKGYLLRKQTTVRHAYETEFLVNSAGVKCTDGKLALPRNGIHRLVLKNPYDRGVDMPMTGMVVAGNATMVGAATAANALTNTAILVANMKARALAQISYQVRAEAGGVSHILAGGLTEVCAYGLMCDIDAALNA